MFVEIRWRSFVFDLRPVELDKRIIPLNGPQANIAYMGTMVVVPMNELVVIKSIWEWNKNEFIK